MKLLAVHDALFFKSPDGGYYCNKIDLTMMEDFLEEFDSIHVIAREGTFKVEYVRVDFQKVKIELIKKSPNPLKNKVIVEKKIKKIIKDYDAVYCRGFNGLTASVIAHRNKVFSFYFLGGCVYDSLVQHGSLLRRLLAKPIQKYQKKIIKKIPLVIYVTQYLVDRYPTEGRSVIWTELKIDSLNDNTILDRRIKKMKNKDKCVIGVIGYFNNEIKGIDTAIKAINLLPNNYSLRILGAGDPNKYNNILNINSTNRVHFDGMYLEYSKIVEWLDSVDIYIQPSRTEGLPKATIEAMSRGCPVVASNVGGLPDLIEIKYLHNPGDFIKLKNLIRDLFEDKEKMIFSCRRNFEKAKSYTPEKLKIKYTEIMTCIKENVRKK